MNNLNISSFSGYHLLQNELTTTASAEHGNGETALPYCENFDSFTDVWYDNGVSKCFYFTLSAALLILLAVPVCMEILKLKRFVFYLLVF